MKLIMALQIQIECIVVFGRDGNPKPVIDKLGILAKEKLTDYLLLSNEGCIRCSDCTYPHYPCRFAEKLFPSVEGFGIRIDALAKSANIKYINGENTVTYFGLLLFRKLDV